MMVFYKIILMNQKQPTIDDCCKKVNVDVANSLQELSNENCLFYT